MIEKIVSGGQTGVDQAGLLIASELGIEIGGWCPKGGLDENGICILAQYPSLQETKTSNPDERTRLNIRDSDGTLIIVPSWPLPEKIKDGTILTIDDAVHQRKPHFIIDLSKTAHVIDEVQHWINEHNIKTLNIAGPRESNSPEIFEKTCEMLKDLFITLQFCPQISY